MRKILFFLLLIFLIPGISAVAQKTISGKITDAKTEEAIPNASIIVKGTNLGTSSNKSGMFSIKVPDGSTVLVITSLGYENKEVTASGEVANITLNPGETKNLDEVVVVGYGTNTKRDITGSVSKVSAKEISNTPATSFESAIQGRAAGVLVQQQNGKLGQGINIRIRGSSSVSAGNEPLYVVDGVPVITSDLSNNGATTNPLADLNMNDIESIDILKDASAAAIYGSRASNGVVLITTKKGKPGTSKIELGYYTGLQKPTKRRKFLDAQQYIDMELAAGVGAAKQDFAAGYYNTLQDALDHYQSSVESRLTRYSAGNDDWKTANKYRLAG